MTPKALTLGADTWTVLAAAASGLTLPFPFRAADAPLGGDEAAAAEQALRASALVTGDSGELIADLHPSVQASLFAHAAPQAAIDAWIGLGPDLDAARFAVQGELASGFVRKIKRVEPRTPHDASQTQPAASETPPAAATQLGPVRWLTMAVDHLVGAITEPMGEVPSHPVDARPAALEAAAALAIVRALQTDHPDYAAAIADGTPPAPLPAAASELQAIARIDATGAGGRTVLLLAKAGGAWWQTSGTGETITFEPLDAAGVESAVAQLIAGALATPAPAGPR